MTTDRKPSRGGGSLDRAVGFRIGAAAGVLCGAAILAVTGARSFWIVAVTAIVGGAVGYWTERSRTR